MLKGLHHPGALCFVFKWESVDLLKGEVRASGSHIPAPLEIRKQRPHRQRGMSRWGWREVEIEKFLIVFVPGDTVGPEIQDPLSTCASGFLFVSQEVPFLFTFIQVLFLFLAWKGMLMDSGMGKESALSLL